MGEESGSAPACLRVTPLCLIIKTPQSHHVVTCSVEKLMSQEPEGSLVQQPLGAKSLQQPCEWGRKWVCRSSLSLKRTMALWETCSWGIQLSHSWTLTHWNCGKRNCVKPLHFGVVCYTAIVSKTEFGLVTRPEIPWKQRLFTQCLPDEYFFNDWMT